MAAHSRNAIAQLEPPPVFLCPMTEHAQGLPAPLSTPAQCVKSCLRGENSSIFMRISLLPKGAQQQIVRLLLETDTACLARERTYFIHKPVALDSVESFKGRRYNTNAEVSLPRLIPKHARSRMSSMLIRLVSDGQPVRNTSAQPISRSHNLSFVGLDYAVPTETTCAQQSPF